MTAALKAAAEKSMRDRCTITRDVRGPESATFDETTLSWAPGPAATAVYAGKCSVVPDTDTRATPDLEGGQDVYKDEYRARIPLTYTAEVGDWLTVTAVGPQGDRDLVGRDFQITRIIRRSRAVTRQIRMVDRTRGPRT